MVDIKNINNNIKAIQWKERYDSLPNDIQKKLDELADAQFKSYQLQVIKQSREYPEIGDIFIVRPRENIEFHGIVVNNHIDNNNGDDLLVVLIFKNDVDVKESIKSIKKEDLLIDPEIVGKEYWTRGYFYKIDNIDIDKKDLDIGFYDIVYDKFCDEYENRLQEEPYLLGTYGVATISGIAYGINKELIINKMI